MKTTKKVRIKEATPWELIKFTAMPFFFAYAMTVLWYGIHFIIGEDEIMKRDAEMMSSGTFQGFWIVYGLFATLVIGKVWTDMQKLMQAIRAEDEETFVVRVDNRVPQVLYLFYWLPAIAILYGFMTNPYSSQFNGITSVGWTSFFFMLIYKAIKDMDDPIHGIFNLEGIPENWLKDDQERNGKC